MGQLSRMKRPLEFRQKLNQYLQVLTHDSSQTAYIELSKEKEIDYFKRFLYRFEAILLDMAECDEYAVILDIGTSPYTFFLKNYLSDCHINTIDYSDHLKLRSDSLGVTHYTADINNGTLPIGNNSIDLVIFTEVLEHIIAPPEQILSEIKRVLRTNGFLILSVPNAAQLSNRIRLLVGKNINAHPNTGYEYESIHGYGHIHEYTKTEITNLCVSLGFKIVRVRMLGEPPYQILKYTSFMNIHRTLYHCVKYLYPNFRSTIQITCQK